MTVKDNRNLVLGIALLIVGVIGLDTLPGMRMTMGGMTGGGMMDRQNMKEMMKGMMGALLPPGIKPENLPDPQSTGAQLLGQYCAQCHDLPGPGMHTANEWPAVVERMDQRMQMMSGRSMMRMMHDIKAPTDNEQQTLVAYLQQHAQMPIDRGRYADLSTPDGVLFEATCAQCHVLPDPKQHKAEEWPGVVERMTQNMKTMGKLVPDRATLDSVVAFLQAHAQ